MNKRLLQGGKCVTFKHIGNHCGFLEQLMIEFVTYLRRKSYLISVMLLVVWPSTLSTFTIKFYNFVNLPVTTIYRCGGLTKSNITNRLTKVSESCTTPLGRRSECISIYECPPILAAFQQRPLPSHVISFLKQSQCGFDEFTPKVCCGPLPAQSSVTTTTVGRLEI